MAKDDWIEPTEPTDANTHRQPLRTVSHTTDIPAYQRMYYKCFNAITDAINCLETMEVGMALHILKKAQVEAEEIYLEESKPNILRIYGTEKPKNEETE